MELSYNEAMPEANRKTKPRTELLFWSCWLMRFFKCPKITGYCQCSWLPSRI